MREGDDDLRMWSVHHVQVWRVFPLLSVLSGTTSVNDADAVLAIPRDTSLSEEGRGGSASSAATVTKALPAMEVSEPKKIIINICLAMLEGTLMARRFH